MAAPPLLALKAIRLSLGDMTLFSGVDLAIGPRDRLCLIGRNGAGKSTLLKIIAGLSEADGGERFEQPGAHIAYLPQEIDFSGHKDVASFIKAGLPINEADADHKVDAMLADVGLEGAADPNTLSGGEMRRAGIARAFIAEPDILLLDEPTNHLDIDTVLWLEARLKAWRGALVLISHDRAFLRNLTSACLWLDRGRIRRLDQPYEKLDDWMAAILEREAVETVKLDKLIAEETRWSHQGITARRARNEGRIRRLAALRAERSQRIARQGVAALETATSSLSGKQVILAEHIGKRYGERVIIRDFSTRILRGDRIGIVGPNGAGKTTLLKILIGELAPDSGSVTLGTNLDMLLIDQKRDSLDPEATVWDTLTGGGHDQVMVRGTPKHVVAYLKDFLFSPAQARSPVHSLSGGEKNRLMLARAFAKSSNLMILDEPTNDLDMETLDLLEDVLADYPGTVLLVSHDRDFLDRIVGSTIALEGDGEVQEYPGGWSDYQRQRGPAPKREAEAKKSPPSAHRPAAALPPKGSRQRLGFKEKRALEQLPIEIEAIERELERLGALLADPESYNRDPKGFAAMTARHAALAQTRSEKEEQWLELEMLREALEASQGR